MCIPCYCRINLEATCHIGVVGRMSNTRPALLPEPFSGDPAGDWKEWVTHFESVAIVNKWEKDEDKLKWLRVRLTGKAQTAFMNLPESARSSYGECIKALQKRFAPESRRELYVAELQTRTKRANEDWASFGDALRTLSDRAYPDLEDKARERLALNQFLSQIENPQVGFGVKQTRPNSVEEAVAATIELESYLSAPGRSTYHCVDSVAPQQSAGDLGGEALAQRMVAGTGEELQRTLAKLSERLQRLEVSLGSDNNSRGKPAKQSGRRRGPIVCWNCGQQGHPARICPNSTAEQQGNFRPSVERAFHERENQDQ